MLMRWSGLRIRDAVTLERTRLINDNLVLYQAKTGTAVYAPYHLRWRRSFGPFPMERSLTQDTFLEWKRAPNECCCRLAT
ncbi:hypothetical protein HDF11_004162 [Tunturiibacter psychrotolerans]